MLDHRSNGRWAKSRTLKALDVSLHQLSREFGVFFKSVVDPGPSVLFSKIDLWVQRASEPERHTFLLSDVRNSFEQDPVTFRPQDPKFQAIERTSPPKRL